MNKVEELIERVRLRDKEIAEAKQPNLAYVGASTYSQWVEEKDRRIAEAATNKVLNDSDIVEGLELLERVRQGTTIEAIIMCQILHNFEVGITKSVNTYCQNQ